MDPQIINQAAQSANQVGLLTWLVTAIAIFCGAIVILVMVQNYKREERYARLQESTLLTLGQKIDACSMTVKESMTTLSESAKYQKEEHKSMIDSLRKTTETLISLAAIVKLKPEES